MLHLGQVNLMVPGLNKSISTITFWFFAMKAWKQFKPFLIFWSRAVFTRKYFIFLTILCLNLCVRNCSCHAGFEKLQGMKLCYSLTITNRRPEANMTHLLVCRLRSSCQATSWQNFETFHLINPLEWEGLPLYDRMPERNGIPEFYPHFHAFQLRGSPRGNQGAGRMEKYKKGAGRLKRL